MRTLSPFGPCAIYKTTSPAAPTFSRSGMCADRRIWFGFGYALCQSDFQDIRHQVSRRQRFGQSGVDQVGLASLFEHILTPA